MCSRVKVSAGGNRCRLFFALWPSPAVRAALSALVTELAGCAQARWLPRENWHLTLCFLGELPASTGIALLSVAALRVAPFELSLTRVRYQKQRQLLWVESEAVPDQLAALVTGLGSLVRDAAPMVATKRWVPHVTLGRRVIVRDALRERIAPIVWPVGAYALVESKLSREGAAYQALRWWPLWSMPPAGTMK